MKVIIVGGAGFIGSNLLKKMMLSKRASEITVIDNLSSGSITRIADSLNNESIRFFNADLADSSRCESYFAGCDLVIHLAANPDISKAETDPSIDFWKGTFLTQNILEIMRLNGVSKIIYVSGSGVYGEAANFAFKEDSLQTLPISTYGASKLACEALLSAYAHLFGISSRILRLANVVGPAQTHGVTYDLVRKLREDAAKLHVLGDGTQLKSYVYITDVLSAIDYMIDSINKMPKCDIYNVASCDRITVKEIAEIAIEKFHKSDHGADETRLFFESQPRGWKADVPNIKLDSSKLRGLGWRPSFTSKKAIELAIDHALKETSSSII